MYNYQSIAKEIKELLDPASCILIVSHERPDGDTIGSGTALLNYLQGRGKKVLAFCKDPIPYDLSHIPGSGQYTNDPEIFKQPIDVVIIVDTGGTLERAGADQLKHQITSDYKIVNLDHHPTNANYGSINLVNTEASSTCEIVANLLNIWQANITPRIADCLLVGIMTDTSFLTNPATKAETIKLASQLLKSGADLYYNFQKTMLDQNVPRLKLWGLALKRLQLNPKYSFASTYITNKDFANCGAQPDDMRGFANYLACLNEADAILILTEVEANSLKVSLRTPYDKPNLAKLAAMFGGGGHQKSSGFTIPGKIVENGSGHWQIA